MSVLHPLGYRDSPRWRGCGVRSRLNVGNVGRANIQQASASQRKFHQAMKIGNYMASVNAWILLPILWIVVAIGWAPMLLSTRLRDLCGRWPTDRVVLNYPLFVTVVVGTHVVTFIAVGVQLPSGGPYLLWAFASTLLVAGVSWLVVAVVLPTTREIHLSREGRLLLAAGAVWYAVLVSVVFGVLALVVFALAFPG